MPTDHEAPIGPPVPTLATVRPDGKRRRKDFVDLTNKRFGAWTVIEPSLRRQYWICQCDCGNAKEVFTADLIREASRSCGCVPLTPEQRAAMTAKSVATKAKRLERRKAREAKAEEARLAKEKAAAEAAAINAQKEKERAEAAERRRLKQNFKYGIDFGPDPRVNPMSIELACYRDRLNTGHPREFHFRKAFEMVWPKFQWNQWCELMIWAWCNYKIICIIGHTRASKTYFWAHLTLLDYLCSPHNTATTLTTTKFDALKTRMWGDMMRAIENIENPALQQVIQNVFKITNTSNEMKFSQAGPSHGDDKFMIQGAATDSADKTAGKIRGQHADRRRITGDEAQDIADAIYVAFGNATSAPDFIGGLLSNPVEKLSKFGDWCKPKGGWGAVHDTDLVWETETPGGVCLHFDGLQSPNIKAGKTIFPYLLTQEYVDFVRTQYGEGGIEWWMYIRGFFPPDGVVARVWPEATIAKAMAGCEFDFEPIPFGSLDPAYEHDDPVLTLGLIGRLRDGKYCALLKKQVRIKLGENKNQTKDRQLANETKRLCIEHHVAPDWFICDTTGNGRSVFALLFEDWSPKIQKVEYGGAATDRPLRLNDTLAANEQVKYFVAELWFRASYMAAAGMICGLGNVDQKCIEDLTARRYTIKQDGERKVMVIESKDEMKKRLNRSPDYGDSAVQVGELMARKGMLGAVATAPQSKRWGAQKRLAQKASRRYSEKMEFAQHR